RSSPRGISHQSSHCEALARFRRSDLAPAEETSASNDRVDQSEVTPACPSWIVGGEENAASTEEGRSGFYRGYADGRCRDYRRRSLWPFNRGSPERCRDGGACLWRANGRLALSHAERHASEIDPPSIEFIGTRTGFIVAGLLRRDTHSCSG